MNDQDVATQLAVLASEVKGLREGVTNGLAALATRVDTHEREIDALRERQIRWDERQKVRREGRRDGTAVGQLLVQRWQLYVAASLGALGVVASFLNIALSHF